MLKSWWVFWNRCCTKRVPETQGASYGGALCWLCSYSWTSVVPLHCSWLLPLTSIFPADLFSYCHSLPTCTFPYPPHAPDRWEVSFSSRQVRFWKALPQPPTHITPFSHSAYLILPSDSFLIHSREVWQTSKSSAVVTSTLVRRRTHNSAFSHGRANYNPWATRLPIH